MICFHFINYIYEISFIPFLHSSVYLPSYTAIYFSPNRFTAEKIARTDALVILELTPTP